MLLGVRWGSLQTKIVAWTLVPTAIILVLVSLVAVTAFRRTTEGLVLDSAAAQTQARASELARVAGSDEGQLAFLARQQVGDAETSTLVDTRSMVSGDPIAMDGSTPSIGSLPQPSASGSGSAARVSDGPEQELVVSVALVPGTPWTLVSSEPWSDAAMVDQRYRQLFLLLIALGLVFPGAVVAVGARRMTQPIRELIQAAQEVAKGNFGRTIRADTGDEIEELAHEFSKMSKELEASYRHLEQRVSDRTELLAARSDAEHRRAEQFRVIAEVGRRMTTILPVDQLLDEIARLLQETFGYYHVGIALVEGEFAIYRAGAGELWSHGGPGLPGQSFGFSPASLRVGEEGVTGSVAATGESMLVPDVTLEAKYVQMAGSATCSELAVPILAKGQVIGVLDVQSDELNAFDDSDRTVMQSLANQAGIAIENARLYEQARQLAVLEERQRVARDLHDSVTQSLYGVTLYADATGRLLEAGDVEQAAGHVLQLKLTAKEALQEMRLLVFELRPPELEKVGLAAAIQARLDAVEGRAGLKTSFVAEGVGRADPHVEEALYRIAQEALNNALKHARASAVTVSLQRSNTGLCLVIADDGVGFDPSEAYSRGGLGLSSMAERAQRLGGSIVVTSDAGEGTHIEVEVPL